MRVMGAVQVWLVCACAVMAQQAAQPQQTTQPQAFAASAAPPAATPKAHGYEVSGIVVNAFSGEPLSKAKVTIFPLLTDTPDDTTTPNNNRQFAGGGGPGGGGFGRGGGAFGGGGVGNGGGGRAGRAGRARGQNQAAEDEEPATEAVTDEAGHFVLSNVSAGKYTLFAERKGYPRQSLDRHAGFSTAVVVGAGKETKNILFRIMPDSEIAGRITDDYGDPVPNGRIILFYKSTDSGEDSVQRRGGTGTDSQGYYHFAHLQPGTYFVVVSAQPWYSMYARMMPQVNADDPSSKPDDGDANLDVAFSVTYYSGSTSENDATPIQLQPGDHFTADMVMNTTPAMHVQFANIDPKTPMMPQISTTAFGQEIFVMAMPQFRGMRAQPPANGAEQAPAPVNVSVSVAPGQYEADMRSFNRGGGGGPGGPPASVSKQTINATGNVVVDTTKGEEPAPVTGTVTFEGAAAGSNSPRGTVNFRKQDGAGEMTGTRTGSDGEINFRLYPGKYSISAGYSHYVMQSVTATGAKVTGRTLEISGTSPVKLEITMTMDDARVEGVVKASDGDKPVAGAFVMLVPEDMAHDQPLIRRFQSGTDGSFQFTKVIPGKYTLVALKDGWNVEWAKPEVMKPYLAKGEPVTIGPKGTLKVTVKAQ
jgi:hypothetical protein